MLELDLACNNNVSLFLIIMKKYICIIQILTVIVSHAQHSFFRSTNNYVVPVSASQASPVITSGLVLNLDAENSTSYTGSGTTWSDISGSNNHATLYNSTPFTSISPTYFSFNGSDQYAKSNTTPVFGIASNNAITAEGWIYLSVNSYDFWFTSNLNPSDCTYRFGSDGSRSLYWDMGQHNDRSFSGFTFTNNSWAHVVFTGGLESGTIVTRIYVNGNLITTQNEGITTLPNTNEFFIGTGETGNSHNFSGRIGAVRIYNRVLSASEVLQNFNNTRSRFGL